jgi:acetylornithine/succinyldiaminopimelate/putrescine aminotransferase
MQPLFAPAKAPPLNHDLMDSFWLPFTPNRQFKSQPRLFVAAEGMHYVTQDGRRILDAMGGYGASMPGTASAASSRPSRRRRPRSISCHLSR